MPSIFNNSSYFCSFDRNLKFKKDLKCFDKIFAFSKPMCRIPSEYISLSKEISFFSFIEYFRFSTDCLPHPSKDSIF